jgi:hypothetical protein
MKHYDTAKRVHRVGQPSIHTATRHYEFPVDEATKDLLREASRREGMNNYSNQSNQAMKDFLRGHDVTSMAFRVFKKSEH